jgi:hypothetical protein
VRIAETQTLADVVIDLLACGGPVRFSARRTWPLHEALLHLRSDGVGGPWRAALHELPGASIRGNSAIDLALADLAASEVLAVENSPGGAWLAAADQQLIEARRALLGRPVAEVDALYRAARFWLTLAMTAAKNWSQATRSSVAMVASTTPNRRQPAPWPMRVTASTLHEPALAPDFKRRANTE